MAKSENQKLKLYYLAKIMKEQTDDAHFLTMSEIIDRLAYYEIPAERKSIYKDMESLRILGMEIEKVKQGKDHLYHNISHDFEMAELKLLVDAIQSSKFITEKKSNELIHKLEGLVSVHEAKQLHRQIFLTDRNKTVNEKIYYNVDEIYNAMSRNCQITFQYFQWNVKKEMELKHDGKEYQVSPLGLAWDDERYYLVAYDSVQAKIKHFRVDKMLHIAMTEERREGKEQFQELNMATYTRKNFGMFGGQEKRVKLLVANDMAGVIIDRFGMENNLIPYDDAHFTVNVDVQVSNQFFGWIFSLGDQVKIIGPEEVLADAEKEVKRLMAQYHLTERKESISSMLSLGDL